MIRFYLTGLLLLLQFGIGIGQAQTPDAASVAFFEQKIRPVLVEQCYQCRSADAVKNKKLRGGLRLDTAEGILKGGDSGPVIIAKKINEGHLLQSIRYTGETKMPPKGKLPTEVIADFEKWIAMGAPDPRKGGEGVDAKKVDIAKGKTWWSFKPIASVQLPKVKQESWVKTPVDRFILAKLEEKNIVPNGLVAKEKLLRRVNFDLVGLPPTPAEMDAFLKDTSPDAYSKLLDRLLESQHYGERWARHWLDSVRFAESSGYEFDGNRAGAFHYRDFVIKALNQDMPYTEFVRQQIAGDHLNPGDFLANSATGFLVAGPYPGQTTAKTLDTIRSNHLDDMVSTLGSSMLGLSVGCARCHDHKYDPIPQNDYYRLVAALGRTDSMDRKLDQNPEVYLKAKAAFDLVMNPLKAAKEKFQQNELPTRLELLWEKQQNETPSEWIRVEALEAKGKLPLVLQADGSYLTPMKAEKNETFTFTAQTLIKNITGIKLDTIGGGDFNIAEITVTAASKDGKTKAAPLKLKPGAVTSEKTKLALAIDGDKKTGWSPVDPKENQSAVLAFEKPLAGFDGGTVLTIAISFINDPIKQMALAFTNSATMGLKGKIAPQHLEELRSVLNQDQGEWNGKNSDLIFRWFKQLDVDASKVFTPFEIQAKLEPMPNLLSVFSATSGRGGDVHFLIRGEVDRKNGVAAPGFLQVLMNDKDQEKRWTVKPPAVLTEPRVALANWITDLEAGAGHLLARVIVNRIWQHHLGKGLVATPNDFGVQGDAPSHPELLEFLAGELIKNNWKLKPIHKLIMQSAVYQENGDLQDGMKVDPANRLFWRRAPSRLEAETIRDAVLAVSATLDPKPFGEGNLDPNNPRRSIYLTVKRSQMVSMMAMFDAPEPIQSIGERSVTTVPTQSLAFLNSPFVRTRAEKLAQRVKPKSAAEIPISIAEAYRIALTRNPTEAEASRMLAFLNAQAASYGTAPTAMDQALSDVCHVLLCLNEFVFVD